VLFQEQRRNLSLVQHLSPPDVLKTASGAAGCRAKKHWVAVRTAQCLHSEPTQRGDKSGPGIVNIQAQTILSATPQRTAWSLLTIRRQMRSDGMRGAQGMPPNTAIKEWRLRCLS